MRLPERATLYAALHRLWGSGGGLLTAALVAAFFSPSLQGYYYTFLALLTLQTAVELGMGELLQQFVSHEWAFASEKKHSLHRLSAILRFSLAWYAAAAVLVFAGLGCGGALYFRAFAEKGTTSWELAWWLAALATALGVLLTPLFSLLEGANRVRTVQGVRLAQGVLGRLAGFAAIAAGAGLFTIPIARLASFLAGLAGLGREGSRELRRLWRAGDPDSFSWRRELWPLQWKYALSWLSGYVLHSLFTPVLFAFHGPVVAGRMGMTVAAASAVSSAAFAAVATKVPRLAIHAAKSEYRDMDALFRRATLAATAVAGLGASLFLGALLLARAIELPLASRFLPPLETSFLFASVLLQQLRFAMGSYLRAHKEEPFVALSVSEALLAIPILILLGRSFGALGMVAGFFVLTTSMLVPAASIFGRRRAVWRHAHPL